jgi:hypothetical protein
MGSSGLRDLTKYCAIRRNDHGVYS